MPKFRKKPVVIEAVQFTEELALLMMIDKHDGPFGLSASGRCHPKNRTLSEAYITIKTLEGDMTATIDDWIIKGVQGELYPCKPDIFSATYDEV